MSSLIGFYDRVYQLKRHHGNVKTKVPLAERGLGQLLLVDPCEWLWQK